MKSPYIRKITITRYNFNVFPLLHFTVIVFAFSVTFSKNIRLFLVHVSVPCNISTSCYKHQQISRFLKSVIKHYFSTIICLTCKSSGIQTSLLADKETGPHPPYKKNKQTTDQWNVMQWCENQINFQLFLNYAKYWWNYYSSWL